MCKQLPEINEVSLWTVIHNCPGGSRRLQAMPGNSMEGQLCKQRGQIIKRLFICGLLVDTNIWTTFEKLCVMALNPARTPLPFIDLDSSWRALSYCCTQCELHRPIWRRGSPVRTGVHWCDSQIESPKLGLPTQQVTLECKRWFDNLILIILISKYMISIYWYIWLPHRDILHSPILASILAHSSRKSLLSLFVRFSVPSAKTQCFL